MSRAEPWYADGLAFECQRSGNCCTGEPGTVRVEAEEIEALAPLVELTPGQFRAAYTRTIPSGRTILREKGNGDCVFYEPGKGCTVYEARPRQCHTWPFWKTNLASHEDWQEAATGCPGMNRGRVWSSEEIQERLDDDGTLSGGRP